MRILIAAVSLCVSFSTASAEEFFGSFSDGPAGRFITVNGEMNFELEREFSFVDPNDVKWTVPEKTVVNGASIPQAFWSAIGGPFDGLYLKASVIHDHYCTVKSKTAFDTHRNFYYGMRANGVPYATALAMYWAVWAFGPDWVIEKRVENTSSCSTDPSGKVTCSVEPKLIDGAKDVPSADLSDPQTLSAAIGKFNAIVKTLNTSNATILDVTTMGEVGASLDSIESNASNFRSVLATEAFKTDPSLLGVVAEPSIKTLDQIGTWPNGQLPNARDLMLDKSDIKSENAPFVLTPEKMRDFQQKLDLSPSSYEMKMQVQ